jgi:hypothetical protein
MQTPNDGGSFCSLIVTTNRPTQQEDESQSEENIRRKDRAFNAVFISSDSEIHLPKIAQSFTLPMWNTTDLPMVPLPLEFLIRHVRQVSENLAELRAEVSRIEELVINDNDGLDFKSLIKGLHICSRELVKLRRRWHFQMTLAKTIRELIEIHGPVIVTQSREYRQLLGIASLQFKLSQSLEYDLNVLPERISNQFNAVSILEQNSYFDFV